MWLDLPLIQQNQIQIRFDHQLPRAWMLPGRYAGSTGSHRNSRIVSTDACIVHESAITYYMLWEKGPFEKDYSAKQKIMSYNIILAF